MDLIAIHGFTPNRVSHSRTPQKVWEDRFNAAWDRASRLETDYELEKDDILIWISGGVRNDEGKTEAECMKEYGERTEHPLFEEYTVALEEESTDTASNVDAVYQIASEQQVDAIHPVSSKDHILRVHREYLFHDDATAYDILPKGSEQTYAESGDKPLLIEMGPYREIAHEIEVSVWGVPPADRAEAGKRVRKVLESFQSREKPSKISPTGSAL